MKTARASGPPRILVVDDEPPLLKMMRVYLQRLGYCVDTAASTEEASALAAQESFAVVVLDGTMEGLGLEELAVRILRGNPTVRVLAASGYPVDMTALEAAAPGRVGFLHKPFTPEMLAATIRRMLGAEEEKEL